MTKLISDRLSAQAPALVAAFAAVRARVRDSGIKGSENEAIVHGFLEEHLSGGTIAGRAEICDSYDRVSGEVDVLLCNESQPFRKGPYIVEGVHAAIQVKASLTSEELLRIDQNCRSVKALRVRPEKGDVVFRPVHRTPEELARVPYVAFCFKSQLSPETIQARLLERYWAKEDVLEQPDAIFVLEPGTCFLNCRLANPSMVSGGTSGKPLAGWTRMDSGAGTLAEFLRFLVIEIPWTRRVANPLRHYFGTHRPFPTWGLEPIDGPSPQPPMDTPGPTP